MKKLRQIRATFMTPSMTRLPQKKTRLCTISILTSLKTPFKQFVILNETTEQIGEAEPIPDEIITVIARMLLPEILEIAEAAKEETAA